jgi:hypothetical protein
VIDVMGEAEASEPQKRSRSAARELVAAELEKLCADVVCHTCYEPFDKNAGRAEVRMKCGYHSMCGHCLTFWYGRGKHNINMCTACKTAGTGPSNGTHNMAGEQIHRALRGLQARLAEGRKPSKATAARRRRKQQRKERLRLQRQELSLGHVVRKAAGEQEESAEEALHAIWKAKHEEAVLRWRPGNPQQ